MFNQIPSSKSTRTSGLRSSQLSTVLRATLVAINLLNIFVFDNLNGYMGVDN